VLTVEGGKSDPEQREYLYRGISSRPFKRQFSLADYVQVQGASFDNGLLRFDSASSHATIAKTKKRGDAK
jgi:molecular chaperone IbpA